MFLVVRPRSPALAPFVRTIGCHAGPAPPPRHELPPRHERILPSGEPALMVNLAEDEFRTYGEPGVHQVGGAMLAGPPSKATVIDTAEQRSTVSVSFTWGGAFRFFAVSLSETRNQLVDLGDLWGRDGVVLRERLLEAASPAEIVRTVETVLLDRIDRLDRNTDVAAPDPAIAFAVRALDRGSPVADVAEILGWPGKRLTARFREQLGLSPKLFARVRRLQRLLADPDRADWAGAAARHGYFDQAHLIHDFRALTGLTPGGYLAAVGEERNHVPFLQSPSVDSRLPLGS